MVIRRLYEFDEEEIGNHFRRLDTDSRRARFCGSVSNSGVTSYAQTIFRYDNLPIDAFVERQIRGIAELRGILHFWPSRAEAAFSVDPEWQNIGIGDALFERVIALAKNRCVRSIGVMCLKANTRMRHLATKHGARLCFDQEVMEAVLYQGMPMPSLRRFWTMLAHVQVPTFRGVQDEPNLI